MSISHIVLIANMVQYFIGIMVRIFVNGSGNLGSIPG